MSGAELPRASAAQLAAWAAEPPVVADCECRMARLEGWTSIRETEWPAQLLEKVATLRDLTIDEPSYVEHHPRGTRYDSPEAPVAPAFFPYNRCEVYRCSACGRHVLRYTEYGGYYIDHRARCLQGREVVDAPLPVR